MHDNWNRALKFVWLPQNDGQPFHVTPGDPGGGTAWGVTETTWLHAIDMGLVEPGLLAEASIQDLAKILHVFYWNACQCDALPDGVDIVVFDIAMLSGPGRAARILQHCVGVKEDGHVGPITLAAVEKHPTPDLIACITTEDKTFMAGLQGWTHFGRGWQVRADACQNEALACVTNTPTNGVARHA